MFCKATQGRTVTKLTFLKSKQHITAFTSYNRQYEEIPSISQSQLIKVQKHLYNLRKSCQFLAMKMQRHKRIQRHDKLLRVQA